MLLNPGPRWEVPAELQVVGTGSFPQLYRWVLPGAWLGSGVWWAG